MLILKKWLLPLLTLLISVNVSFAQDTEGTEGGTDEEWTDDWSDEDWSDEDWTDEEWSDEEWSGDDSSFEEDDATGGDSFETGGDGTAAPTRPTTSGGDLESTEGLDLSGESMEQLLPWSQKSLEERQPLAYDHVREADVFWHKTIWRVIDTREKMNLPFKWPKRPLISILMEAVRSGEATAYDGLDDEFKVPLDDKAMNSFGGGVDTTWVYDFEQDIEVMKVVVNEFDPMKVNKFRLKEVWYFDEETSTMQVRIMGIAPILDSYDEWGNYRGELPMFWVYFPGMRDVFVKEVAFNPFPNSVRLTWDDLFSFRLFSSYIYKEENVKDYRIQDYANGINRLYESERIKTELFNFEHDLWSY